MSFSRDVKDEICKNLPSGDCCVRAMLYGLLLCSHSFGEEGIALTTDNEAVATTAKTFVKQLFGDGFCVYVIERSSSSGRTVFALHIVDREEVRGLLAAFGHQPGEVSVRIKEQNFVCEHCVRAFLAGCFLSCGRVTDPQKEYHLELVTSRTNLTKDLMPQFVKVGLVPKYARRQGSHVLYFKDSGEIEELLTLFGAPMSAVQLMNVKIYKEIRNQVNRITNCETANIDKTVSAAAGQVEDIQYLLDQHAEDRLSDELRAVAMLRLQNPDMSLAELLATGELSISRSGLNHRLAKIRSIAKALREERADKPID